MNCRFLLLVIFLIAALGACDTSPNVAVPGDYYPSKNTTNGYFLREQYNPTTKEVFFTDTVQIAYNKDVNYKDRVYTELDSYSKFQVSDNQTTINQDVYKLVRKSGCQYFTPYSSDSSEYVFLDTGKDAGASWTYYSGFENESKAVYTIKEVNGTRTVNGVTYKNVVEVLVEMFFKTDTAPYTLSSSSTNYYAKDIGPIYSSTEFYTYLGGLRITLLN